MPMQWVHNENDRKDGDDGDVKHDCEMMKEMVHKSTVL